MIQGKDILGSEIRKFISRNVDSVATLEILLFFRKWRETEWSVDQIAIELRSSAQAVDNCFQRLVKKGFLKRGTSNVLYRYEAISEELDGLVEKLAELYARFPMRVIEQIYSPPKSAAEELADAFKLKSEDEDG